MGRFPQRLRPSEPTGGLLPSGAFVGNMIMAGRSQDIPFPVVEGDLRQGQNYFEWRRMGPILADDLSVRGSFMFIVQDGKLLGRGSATSSTLGTGDDTYQNDFVEVGPVTPPPGEWTQVSCGPFHSGAINDGFIYMWGSNGNGRTGRTATTGFTTRPLRVSSPTGESEIDDFVWVDCGFDMTAGIRANGELYTWGNNASGGTGHDTTSGNTTRPLKVGTDTDWAKVRVGQNFMIASKTNGSLWGWGLASRNGSNVASSVPQQIGTDTDWEDFASARSHTMAIKDGVVVAWGLNSFGRTGRNIATATNTTTPTEVVTTNITGTPLTVGANETHSLLATTDGIFATGSDSNSALGTGDIDDTSVAIFTRVAGADDVDYAAVKFASGDGSSTSAAILLPRKV